MNLTSNLKLSRCPHCSVASPLLKVRDQFQTKDEASNNARTWGVYVCSSCGGVVTAWATNSGFSVQEFFPQIQLISEDIPEMPRAYLQQAHSSFHAPAGAVMLAASAVDAMLKQKGLTEGSLYSRIQKACESNIITEDMAKWAHEVRLDANDQRHADQNAVLPSQDDAKRVFDFSLSLAEILFVLPSRVARGIKQAETSAG
ncbi:DUF4145 domain-containing protein [Vibrio parahaemolyticus]|uniref:DUF4145 domain-containing protein n=1 Tax=Vibrio parahaemolyticus TaxID=670 RepID=UPI00046C958E|nr:DUF4145 domain-containing protein [Vibrio parahaemolyticus]ELS9504856.1 DUF4145 domain-containing protein [Vibrio parahaemolyticus]MBE3972437.1 DUF4145 domain-containing protein [Vibrio parahaemolyticus]MBE3981449.1 DUF4145 domain-containing protein [Vibrio parahaemolyticus]MBE5118807.1 DUF4145 domain-containing protein [Vibrio parahaemolyticus]MBM5041348.1 DUF4145 domain-containing protein [Vibrio parahaemolyticus]